MFFTRRHRHAVSVTAVLAMLAPIAACGSSGSSHNSTASTASTGTSKSTATPITIGLVGDLTGVSSSTYADGPGGAQARINLQNAQGGVNGHLLKLTTVDDQSSPATEVTGVQDLISKGVFAIVADSTYAYAGTKVEQQDGIPEMPVCPCGPQYAELPYTNTFSYSGPGIAQFGSLTYTTTVEAQFLKDVGVTKLAGLAYGISVASQDSVKELYAASKQIGGPTSCYTNYSLPFGAVDFTASALQIKASGCNGVVGSFVDNSDVALAQAVKNGGIKATQLYFTGYDEDILDQPAAQSAFQGAYATDGGPNFTTPNAAVQAMVATLQKYDPGYKGGIPDYGLYGSYIAMDLIIKGLELAGPKPTRSTFITNLRNLDSYNAEGILPTTVSFRNFGTPQMLPKRSCAYFMQLVGAKFVPYKNAAICGTPVGLKGIS